MEHIGRLTYFEWKKIVKKKGTWITLGIMIAFMVLTEVFYLFGSTYIEDQFLETHLEGREIDRENAKKLYGRKIDDGLLKEMQAAYEKYENEENTEYMLTEDYQEHTRPYSIIYQLVRYMMIYPDIPIDPLTITEEGLYRMVPETLEKLEEGYGLTEKEKAYWKEEAEKVEMPFTYKYADGYDFLYSMSGMYRISMLVTFLAAICMGAVFADEHGRKTDQLVLCSKLGRKQAYFAKILAGSLFILLSTAILLFLTLLLTYTIYGLEGFGAAIQLYIAYYPKEISVGQVCLIMTGILFLSSVLIGIFTMIVSESTHSGIASMAIVVALMFLARLVVIPYKFRILSQAWNFFPINILKFDQGFADLRLLSVFGIKLTSWQFAPILYIILGALLVWFGKIIYCRYQVEGR